MPLELVKAEEVIGKRARTKGEKYGKYAESIRPHLDWIRDEIKNSKDGSIILKVKDVVQEMGPDFVGKDDRSIYNGLRFTLFTEGIVIDLGTHKDGDKLLVMRFATDTDQLPAYLAKYLEDDENSEE